MAQINPHINFNGNAEEAFQFYKSVFGGEFSKIMRFKDMAGLPTTDDDAEKIMHIALPIGSNVLIGNDVPAFMGRVDEQENRSKIAVSAQNLEEAQRIFEGLSTGATVEVPMDESPWATHFGMLRDKFGIEWIVEFDPASNR